MIKDILRTLYSRLEIYGLVDILMMLLDGQTVSGYGANLTFHFPEEKRKEIQEALKQRGDW